MCKVIKSGRSFLRCLIDLSKVAKRPNHHIQLNLEARSDIEWWYRFTSSWNGVSMFWELRRVHPGVQLTSDASGKWGCGAFYDTHWFQLQWQESLQHMHITIKELIPIVLAAAIWGREWTGLTVQARCDDAAVVADFNQDYSKNADVMHLLRTLAFIKAKFRFLLVASHIPGKGNDLADVLSRDNLSYFLSNHPQANENPSSLPQELLDLIVVVKPDWTSVSWISLWTAIFEVV